MKVLKPIDEFDKGDLNYCLKYLVVEIRNQKGDDYPPGTLKEIVALIQHYFQHSLKYDWSVFNDKEFHAVRNVLDAQMRRLAQKGMVKSKKRAAPISFDEEEEL